VAAAQVFEDCSNYIIPAKVVIGTGLRLQEAKVGVNEIRPLTEWHTYCDKHGYTAKVFEKNSEAKISKGEIYVSVQQNNDSEKKSAGNRGNR
jgi:hypothetical protein